MRGFMIETYQPLLSAVELDERVRRLIVAAAQVSRKGNPVRLVRLLSSRRRDLLLLLRSRIGGGGERSRAARRAAIRADHRSAGAVARARFGIGGSYLPNADPAQPCGNEEPVGGGVLVPPSSPANPLTSVYAAQTRTGKKGQIFITIAGDYNISPTAFAGIAPMHGSGTWTITGGTGAYQGLQGKSDWSADLGAMLSNNRCRHAETAQVWWTK